MPDDNSHIVLLHDERVPGNILDEFCANVNANSLSLERVPRPESGPQAGIEWLAPPVIALFLLKPYFDSFMKEAGKDHYLVLKGALRNLWGKLFSKDRNFRFTVVTASGEKKLQYSMLFAIYTTVDDGHLIKFLIHEDCSEDEYAAAIDSFLNFIESSHLREQDAKQIIDLDREKKGGGITLLEYDGKSKSLRIVNPRSNSGNA